MQCTDSSPSNRSTFCVTFVRKTYPVSLSQKRRPLEAGDRECEWEAERSFAFAVTKTNDTKLYLRVYVILKM